MSPTRSAASQQADAHRGRPAERGSDRGRQADRATRTVNSLNDNDAPPADDGASQPRQERTGKGKGKRKGNGKGRFRGGGGRGVSAAGTAAEQPRSVLGKSLPVLGFKLLVEVMADPGGIGAWAHCLLGHRATCKPSRFNRQRGLFPLPIPDWTVQRVRDALQWTNPF